MVDKEEYYLQLNKRYDQNTVKKPWDLKKLNEIIDILQSYQEKIYQNNTCMMSSQEKYYGRKYDLLELSGISKVILKQKTLDDIIYVTPIEEFFDKIDEQHKATGHGGRDKVLHNLKKKCNIPKLAVQIYGELCTTCNLKKTQKHAGLVVKPIISKDFNVRGQVDLIDFQSCADGIYKWLLNYQDHSTKFLYLRPLQTKKAREVAFELLKIFLEQGAPVILQSDNGREFTAEIIKELLSLWPECKIIHGRPRHPQSQGSVERSNQDVEQMLRIWMEEHKTPRWSIGCYFVQWQKNTSLHRIIGRSPYKSLYGADPKIGLKSTNLPLDLIDKILTEEDLKAINANLANNNTESLPNNSDDDDNAIIEAIDLRAADTIQKVKIISDDGIEIASEVVDDQMQTYTIDFVDEIKDASANALNQDTDKGQSINSNVLYCCVCDNESTGAQTCSKCNKIVHVTCGISYEDDEGFGCQVTCNHCVNEENIRINRTKSYEGQLKGAEEMKKQNNFQRNRNWKVRNGECSKI